MKEFIVKRFHELSLNELYMILRMRSQVFIVEQDCVYQDIDNLDQDAIHVWMTANDKVVAYCRVLKANTYLDEIAVGRVITLERGKGYGLEIFQKGVEIAQKELGAVRIKIRAQQQAEKFYEKADFHRIAEPFMYEGLMHVDMIWTKPSEYEQYCRQQEKLSEMLDDDGRCFPEMAEGQFVRGH